MQRRHFLQHAGATGLQQPRWPVGHRQQRTIQKFQEAGIQLSEKPGHHLRCC